MRQRTTRLLWQWQYRLCHTFADVTGGGLVMHGAGPLHAEPTAMGAAACTKPSSAVPCVLQSPVNRPTLISAQGSAQIRPLLLAPASTGSVVRRAPSQGVRPVTECAASAGSGAGAAAAPGTCAVELVLCCEMCRLPRHGVLLCMHRQHGNASAESLLCSSHKDNVAATHAVTSISDLCLTLSSWGCAWVG